ncbi:thioredoxin family protein [Nitratifractor sp.]
MRELTDGNYEKLLKQSDRPVFVDFYSPTCGPCRSLLALIEGRLVDYAEEQGVTLLICDVSRNPRLAEAFKIRSVPFTIAVLPDGRLKYPELGLKDEAYYFGVIDKLSGKGGFFSRLFG